MADRAEAAAAALCSRYGLVGPEDIELEAICIGEGLVPTEGPIRRADAWLVTQGGLALARVREDIPFTGQKRFALAHELGHWLLHRSLGTAWYDDSRTLAGYRADPREVEASAFAAALLIPPALLARSFPGLSPTIDHVLSISEAFQVGPFAAARRVVLSPGSDAMMVVSDGERTLYYCRRDDCPLPPIRPGTPVPEGAAKRAAANVGERSRSEDGSAWFWRRHRHLKVLEDSLRPSEEPATITILRPV